MSDRNEEIIDLYRNGSTAIMLARSFGLSHQRIRQIVEGVKKEKKIEEKPITQAHRRLGVMICDYRFDHHVDRTVMAKKLGWSVRKLARLDQGYLDPTMLDLQDLATYMKKDLGELINNVFNRH